MQYKILKTILFNLLHVNSKVVNCNQFMFNFTLSDTSLKCPKMSHNVSLFEASKQFPSTRLSTRIPEPLCRKTKYDAEHEVPNYRRSWLWGARNTQESLRASIPTLLCQRHCFLNTTGFIFSGKLGSHVKINRLKELCMVAWPQLTTPHIF